MLKKLPILLCLCLTALALPGADVFRSRACLNGEWEAAFSSTPEPPPDAVWSKVRVPSIWNRGNTTWRFPEGAEKAGYGVFRLRFPVPAEWKGKRVKLFFEHLEDAHRVSLNGKLLHESPHMAICTEIDATAAVEFGKENELFVATAAGTSRHAGIGRDVFLEAVPAAAIHSILVQPSVRKKELGLQLQVEDKTGTPGELELSGRVLDGGKPVLAIPARKVDAASGAVSLRVPWKDPVLWGFGEYGAPHLYTLQMELKRDGKTVDVKHERFGFREFYTEGDKFMLNGKPIYLKGDLYTKTRDHAEHPAAATAFLQRMRASNLNFLRWHTSARLDNSVWFEVADELGFPMQPEMWRPFTVDGKPLPADDPAIRNLWKSYVTANYNHPSIVSWCVDNESFSVGLTSPENLRKIDPERLKAYDNLISFVRALDPTRIVEINHNYSIWPFVRMNKFSRENFQVFNIHPYGNILKTINAEEKAVGFNGEVPVLVGEIFAFENPIDFMQDPRGGYAEQWRQGESYDRQIRDAAAAKHVSGSVLCAETGSGHIGFVDSKTFYLGPWDDDAKVIKDGKVAEIRKFNVFPDWPSLSGRGSKVEFFPGWAYYGGNFGLNLNWFDPNAPMFRKSLVDERIAKAYFEVDGKAAPPLPATRMPEVVATLGRDGKPLEREFVYLRDPARPGELAGVLTDPRGTAWFRLGGTGRYALIHGGQEKEFEITSLPALTDKPGYGYLTWIDLGGIDPAQRRKELDQPVRKEISTILTPGEILQNRDFEYWQTGTAAECWASGGERGDDAAAGVHAVKIVGNNHYITQRIKLEKGKTYRISGAIKKLSGKSAGSIQVTSSDYKMKFLVRGSEESGQWQRFSKLHVADGTEYYFYIRNHYMGDEGAVLYDDLSIRPVDDAPAATAEKFEPGPFPLPPAGFIRDWLVLGPFPNRGDELKGYEAATTDYLKPYGGEAAYRPVFRRTATAAFGSGFYWTPGEYRIRWQPLRSERDRVSLDGVSLPEAVIAGRPANHVAAYLACIVVSPDERDIRIGMGSDDGYVLWLNGEKIGSCLANRGAAADQESYAARLRKGENLLMLKAIQESGGWEVMVKITDRDGKPCSGLEIRLPEEKSLLPNGDFRETENGRPKGWSTTGVFASNRETPALELTGKAGQATRIIRLEPGATYRVEGKIFSPLPKKFGVIGVRDLKYNWLLQLKSRGLMNEWETLSGTFRVPENMKDAYFYCLNWYPGEEDKLYYADVKLFRAEGEE